MQPQRLSPLSTLKQPSAPGQQLMSVHFVTGADLYWDGLVSHGIMELGTASFLTTTSADLLGFHHDSGNQRCGTTGSTLRTVIISESTASQTSATFQFNELDPGQLRTDTSTTLDANTFVRVTQQLLRRRITVAQQSKISGLNSGTF
jgi:hypothetical protein